MNFSAAALVIVLALPATTAPVSILAPFVRAAGHGAPKHQSYDLLVAIPTAPVAPAAPICQAGMIC